MYVGKDWRNKVLRIVSGGEGVPVTVKNDPELINRNLNYMITFPTS